MKAELDQLTRQAIARAPEHIAVAGEQLITIRSSWELANKAQRRDMLHLMLEAVYVDTDEGAIAGYKPHPDFELLFRQTRMREVDGRFIPDNPMAPAPEPPASTDDVFAA